jgi:hypothetical protein
MYDPPSFDLKVTLEMLISRGIASEPRLADGCYSSTDGGFSYLLIFYSIPIRLFYLCVPFG